MNLEKIVTNLAAFEITNGKFLLLERVSGFSVEEIIKAIEGYLVVNGAIRAMKF